MLEEAKTYIEKSNLSQACIARHSGVPKRFISNLKTGRIENGTSRYSKKETIDEYLKRIIGLFDKKAAPNQYPSTSVSFMVYDLEISPLLGWAYGTYDTNILKVEKECMLLSFSYLIVNIDENHSLLDGDLDNVKCVTLYDMNFNEEKLVKKLWDLINSNDIICGYNNKMFDNKMANSYFMKYNLPSPSPYKTLDMMKEWKSNARLSRNGLDHVCDELFGEHKTELKVADLWYSCLIERDKDSWEKLALYNKQDTYLTYKLLIKMSSYIQSNVNIALLMHIPDACPVCGYLNEFEVAGYYYASTNMYEQYRCKKCGHYIHSIKQPKGYTNYKPLYKK